MIDFTDYTTYLYGFAMLAFLYLSYTGSFKYQEHYKPEYRCTKNKAISACIFNTVMIIFLYYIMYAATAELVRQGYNSTSIFTIKVWLVFWMVDAVVSSIGAYRGAKKLNEEEAQ
ncbi:hypothetical protein [Aeromonas hydrophila]|uniref:hypothetical protein n=1 Tax=Aeromonas hydrophila TaxID=644 RepID=UPI003D1B01CA